MNDAIRHDDGGGANDAAAVRRRAVATSSRTPAEESTFTRTSAPTVAGQHFLKKLILLVCCVALAGVIVSHLRGTRDHVAETIVPILKLVHDVTGLSFAEKLLKRASGPLKARIMKDKPDNAETLYRKVITKAELAKHDGKQSPKIYLAVLGRVYDVTKGKRFYSAGEHYSFFAAKDASRAYITGDFEKDLNDQIDDFEPRQAHDLQNWVVQYDDNKDYPFVGLVCGTFYYCPGDRAGPEGTPTPTMLKFKEKLQEADRMTNLEKLDRQEFPTCNSEWKQGHGGNVWCSENSGGVQRDWAGKPRLYKSSVGGKSNAQPRCACVPNDKLKDPRLALYPNCDADADKCPIPEEAKKDTPGVKNDKVQSDIPEKKQSPHGKPASPHGKK